MKAHIRIVLTQMVSVTTKDNGEAEIIAVIELDNADSPGIIISSAYSEVPPVTSLPVAKRG